MKKFSLKKCLLSVIACMLVCCFLFTGCNSNNSEPNNDNPPDFINNGDNLGGGKIGTLPTEIDFSEQIDSVLNSGNVDLETLKNDTDSSNATFLQDDVIQVAGNYILSGNYQGLTINAKKGETVHLFLNNATISSSTTSGIIKSDNSINLIITVIENTTNTISTSGDFNALQVKGNLYINGSGSLNIYSNGNGNGIKVSKTCQIVDCTININDTKHGITAESVSCQDCSINISNALKDGINAECDFDNKKGTTYEFTLDSGYITLNNVNYTANVNGDGIQADTFVYINEGKYSITTNGNFVSYSQTNLETYELENDDFRYIKNGTTYQKVASDYHGNISSMYALTQSCKGIKVGEISYDTDGDDIENVTIYDEKYIIMIVDGEFKINSTDDAIHTNSGSTIIKNGTFTINTFDDGITSDYLSLIENGNISIESCYEGIEGAYVKITGGNITINSSDDGINSASDDTSIKEYIIITDGNIEVSSNGDGLDSNGSILISDGTIVVNGPTSQADGALDAETGIIVTGGKLFATSSLGMIETPSTNSSQFVVSVASNNSISNSTITLKDSNQNVIETFNVKKSCQSIIISSPLLEKNQTYTLYNDSSLLSTFTITDVITYIGSSGNNFNGGNPPPNSNRKPR